MGRTLLGNVSAFAGVFAAGAIAMGAVEHFRPDEPESSERASRSEERKPLGARAKATEHDDALQDRATGRDAADPPHHAAPETESGESLADVLSRFEAAYAQASVPAASTQRTETQRTEVVIVLRDERSAGQSEGVTLERARARPPSAATEADESANDELVILDDVHEAGALDDDSLDSGNVREGNVREAQVAASDATAHSVPATITQIDQRKTNVASSAVTIVSAPTYYAPWVTAPVRTTTTRSPSASPIGQGSRPRATWRQPPETARDHDPFRPIDYSLHNNPWGHRWGGGVP